MSCRAQSAVAEQYEHNASASDADEKFFIFGTSDSAFATSAEN